MKPGRAWVFVLPLLVPLAAHAALRAWLDSDTVAPGDTVELTLHHDGRSGTQPDLGSLEQDFDVLGTRSSTSIQIINGRTSSGTDVVVTLSPKRAGSLTVPSITWDGDRSAALPLEVTAASEDNGKAGSGNPASARTFLETSVDEKQPYVQAAVSVTVRVYTAQTLYHANLDLPATSDALVMQVGSDENDDVERNGRSYHVLTRHYVVFPQRSGELQLSGPVLSGEVAAPRKRIDPFGDSPFSGFFNDSPFGGMLTTTRPIRLHGDPLALNVRPRPANAAGSYWLPAKQVTLEGQWHPDPPQVHVGDPVTLDLQLDATGLTAEQLPDIAGLLTLPAGLKSYPDKAKLQNSQQGDTVVGSRRQSIALIADQPGQFALPALELRWWDTKANAPRAVTLPARTLTVLPAAGAAVPSTQSSRPPVTTPAQTVAPSASRVSPAAPASNVTHAAAGDSVWRWISAGCALLWLATLGAWFLSRRKRAAPNVSPAETKPHSPDTSKARAAFREACRRNDALAARRHLLDWVAAAAPDTRPAGLNGLARASENEPLAQLLRQLDRACFTGDAWEGQALAEALVELPIRRQKRHTPRDHLAPLYH